MAVAPPELPILVIIPEPFPMVVVLLEVKVVNAPDPAVVAPTETKLAAPAVVTDQSASVMETPVAEDEPMAMVLATAPVPILIVLALLPVPKLTVPVEVESKVKAPVSIELMVNGMLVSEPAAAIVGPEPVAAGVMEI